MVGLGPTHPGRLSSLGGCPAPRPIRWSVSASRSLDRNSTGSGYLRHLLYTIGYCNSALTARHTLVERGRALARQCNVESGGKRRLICGRSIRRLHMPAKPLPWRRESPPARAVQRGRGRECGCPRWTQRKRGTMPRTHTSPGLLRYADPGALYGPGQGERDQDAQDTLRWRQAGSEYRRRRQRAARRDRRMLPATPALPGLRRCLRRRS